MNTPRNPFAELERLFDRLNRELADASREWDGETAADWWAATFDTAAADLVETESSYLVTVDLPGFEKDDVEVDVTDHELHVNADWTSETDEETREYVSRERRHRSVHRTMPLPGAVDVENVSATMQNGVLTVTLPRLDAAESRTIEIE